MTNLEWDDNEWPLAYLITFRTYGTWLHGDDRFSIDRHGKNLYGAPKIAPDGNLTRMMKEKFPSEEFLLDAECRTIVERAFRNVCEIRGYSRFAVNVRTNHAHSVVSAAIKPDIIMNAFKANATRELREAGLISPEQKIWSRG